MNRRSFVTALFGAPIAAKSALASAGTATAHAIAKPLMHVPVVRDFAVVRRYGDMSRYSEIVSQTLATYRSDLDQAIRQNNPLLRKLNIRSRTGSGP